MTPSATLYKIRSRNLVSFLTGLIVLILWFPLTARGDTITVGKNLKIKSIKTALAISHDGDVIRVHGGVYAEGKIVVNRQVTLTGVNYPVIRGNRKEDILFIDADRVVVEGFSIENSGLSYINDLAGIKVNKRKKCVLRNNRLLKNHFGIYLKHSNDCRIENNFISGESKDEVSSGNGIHLWYCSRATIRGNTCMNHRDGIYLEFVDHSTIQNNRSEHNLRYGLHFMFSNSNSYIHNRFISNGAGVAVMYSKDILMLDNLFEKNWGSSSYGLLLKDITDSEIRGNRFSENSIAVYADGAGRNTIQKNDFISNGWALKILGSSNDNRFIMNNFVGNSFDVITNTSSNTNVYERNYWSEYTGYDLDHNGEGDVPYKPVKLISVIVAEVPEALMLLRSPLISLLNFAEKVMPSLTPPLLEDRSPAMKMFPHK